MNELILSKLEVGTLDASTNDLSAVTRGFQVAPVTMTPAASVTVTAAEHSGRPLLIDSIATTGADNYILPIPSFIGETYNFMWSGIVADGDNLIFRSSAADGLTFTGGFFDFDTDDATVAGYVICRPTSADDDRLTITNPESFNITFMATSLTNYHCTGYIMSTDTASAFDDQ